MKLAPSNEQIVCMKFDHYVKKCCRNEARNIRKHQKFKRRVEVLIKDYSIVEVARPKTELEFANYILRGHEILIMNPLLLDALESLNDSDRELILLVYYLGYKPRELTTEFKIVERSIYKRCKRILEELKMYMEEHNNE
ncbi:sigma-70 family RNA polymerase sigma factor [Acidaminobacter sp. JC074]|uniref:RNA polymerase sigma factor n=1 Tax=Acidaminobacter sp. JC074 TaxID=2530199 RepID=UPI001F102A62|nr:hypothetical protein [Acidaminobacter sp. JC074]MCH4888914.1 sigma-70 family RNA polymerase sigma factor [Acidaminobacter sp. JC074]